MNKVSFPGLGLNFKFSSIAFRIFDIEIYWYSICIVLGIVLALILCKMSKENFKIEFSNIIDITISALIFGIIGARFYYVIFNLDYYLKNPIKILSFRDGGLGIYGGLIFGSIAGIFRAKKLEVKPLDLFDYVVPFVSLAQSIGRWGNFFNVEAYGVETKNFLRMRVQNVDVHPTFLYESVSTFVIFCWLRILQKNRKFDGQIVLLYIISYSFIRFFIEGLRVDSLMFLDFRVSQVISVLFFAISTYIYFKRNKMLHKTK